MVVKNTKALLGLLLFISGGASSAVVSTSSLSMSWTSHLQPMSTPPQNVMVKNDKIYWTEGSEIKSQSITINSEFDVETKNGVTLFLVSI